MDKIAQKQLHPFPHSQTGTLWNFLEHRKSSLKNYFSLWKVVFKFQCLDKALSYCTNTFLLSGSVGLEHLMYTNTEIPLKQFFWIFYFSVHFCWLFIVLNCAPQRVFYFAWSPLSSPDSPQFALFSLSSDPGGWSRNLVLFLLYFYNTKFVKKHDLEWKNNFRNFQMVKKNCSSPVLSSYLRPPRQPSLFVFILYLIFWPIRFKIGFYTKDTTHHMNKYV